MEDYPTRYGILHHIGEYSLYSGKSLKECMLLDKVELVTEYGTLIPQYEFEENRRKYIYSVSFYEDGALSRVALNERTRIPAPIGDIEAELITFYKSGKIKRLFPLNGRISAYWDENDEYRLAQEVTVKTAGTLIKTKIIGYSFYENGALKALTFWPRDAVKLDTPIGSIRVRIGVSFYPDGRIKSVEPSLPVLVQTPIGPVKAYDYNANGISGDRNSLVFTADGAVQELVTSVMKVSVRDRTGKLIVVFSPEQEWDEDGLEISFTTLRLSFEDNRVCFNDTSIFDMTDNSFTIEPYTRTAPSMCDDCASCGKCSAGEIGSSALLD